MIRIALFLFAIPICISAQSLNTDLTDFIKKVALHRSAVIQESNPATIGKLLNKWREEDVNLERMGSVYLGVQVILGLVNEFDIAPKDEIPLDSDEFLAYLNDELRNYTTLQLNQQDLQIIAENTSLLDLIAAGLLEPEYPFKIVNDPQFYKELEFYDLEPGDKFGILTAWTSFALVVGNLYEDLEMEVGLFDDVLIEFFKLKIRNDNLVSSSSSIKVVPCSSREAQFESSHLDKIVIRSGTFHHLRKPNAMLQSLRRSLKPSGVLLVTEELKELGDEDSCRNS